MHILCRTSKLTFSERPFSVGVKGEENSKNIFFFHENMGLIIRRDRQMQEIKLKVFAVEPGYKKMCISL